MSDQSYITGTVGHPLAIVVLNWNNADDTLACLGSLMQLERGDSTVVVVDNGSSDDSVAQIRNGYPGVTIIETGTNLGYAGGNNVGIRYALAQDAYAVCILNNDVVVEPDFLTSLLAVLASSPEIGVVTPLVAEALDRNRVWTLGASIERSTSDITRQHAGREVAEVRLHTPFETEIASGAAMLVRSEVFATVGFMDEGFFLYYEESDWCLRVRRLGYRIVAVPQAVVYHKVSATLGQYSPIIDYYMVRNQLHFIRRNWTGLHRWRLWFRALVRQLFAVAAYTVKSEKGRRLPHRNARIAALRDAILNRWNLSETVSIKLE